MCLAHGHNTVMPVRLEPRAPRSQSSTLPLSHCALLRVKRVKLRTTIDFAEWEYLLEKRHLFDMNHMKSTQQIQ